MYKRDLEPVETGWEEPHDRGETPQKEGPRAAGTHARPEVNIDKAIDEDQDTGNRPQSQPFVVRYLVKRYSVSTAFAAIIAAELDMVGPRMSAPTIIRPKSQVGGETKDPPPNVPRIVH